MKHYIYNQWDLQEYSQEWGLIGHDSTLNAQAVSGNELHGSSKIS
jgi:hypothetical protein